MQCGITSQKSILLRSASKAQCKECCRFCTITSRSVLISVALHHYPCLFNRTKSCVWQLPCYLSVSADGVVKLSVSVSAESQFTTFGQLSVSAETRNSVSVGL